MALVVIRILFVLASAVVGAFAGEAVGGEVPGRLWGGLIGACAAGIMVGLEIIVTRRQATLIPTLVLGLLLGLLLGPQIAQPILLIPSLEKAREIIVPFLVFMVAFLATVVIYRTRDAFKFSFPYVEFRKELGARRPLILDTSAIIDGRFADLVATRVVDETIVVPRFVLQELQAIADSADRLKRNRGRRGLDILQKLREDARVGVQIDESRIDGVQEVDAKLVTLAKSIGGRIVTTDFNLNKVARVQGVDVVNVNEIAAAMKPAYLPGEPLSVKIVKAGAEAGQGVGYLDDGTMVVVEGARGEVGKEVHIVVTSSLQTHAGKMLFGKLGSV